MLGEATQTQEDKHCAFPGRCRAKIFTFVCGDGGMQEERKSLWGGKRLTEHMRHAAKVGGGDQERVGDGERSEKEL